MLNLLSSGFFRLFRDRFFLGAAALSFVCGVAMPLTARPDAAFDFLLMNGLIFIGFFCAGVTSLFLGAEHSDGTIRSKLCAGYSRAAIYLSSLFLSFASTVLLFAAYALPCCLIAPFTLDSAALPENEPLRLLLALLMLLSVCALMTLLGMLLQSRAAAAVLSFIVLLALFAVCANLTSSLMQPEMAAFYSIDGDVSTIQNPQYPTGIMRTVYEWVVDLLPTGLLFQLRFGEVAHPLRAALLSGGFSAAVTLCGTLVFRRQNIR